jgi:hypothetical protein
MFRFGPCAVLQRFTVLKRTVLYRMYHCITYHFETHRLITVPFCNVPGYMYQHLISTYCINLTSMTTDIRNPLQKVNLQRLYII